MSDVELMQTIVKSYNDDADFGAKALQKVLDHFAKKAPSKSETDPERLGTMSTFISRLKMACLNEAGSIAIDEPFSKEFDAMTVADQLKFQKTALKTGVPNWVLEEQIMPANLDALRMPKQIVDRLKRQRVDINTKKLRSDRIEVDCDQLMNQLFPLLDDGTAKWNKIAAALLLATGRRTIEILKTGDFYLRKDMQPDGYFAMFSGQAKSLDNTPFAIPLLAPFATVHAAMKRLREQLDTTEMTTQKVNTNYQKQVSAALSKYTELTPHAMRAVYGCANYELLGKNRPSLIGYLSNILGQSSPASAIFYQRVAVTITNRYAVKAVENNVNDPWVSTGKVDDKCIAGIKEMMLKKMKITSTSIRSYAGGSFPVIKRVMKANEKLIDEYNKTL